MTKRLSITEKIGRKPASRACVFCHSKHLQCSNERPCRNCVKRDLGHECQDVVRKSAKYMKHGQRVRQSSSSEGESILVSRDEINPPLNIKQEDEYDQNPMLNTTNDVLHRISSGSRVLDLGPRLLEQTTPGSIDMFNSNYLNQEYLMLGDIILHSKPSSPSPSNTSSSEVQAYVLGGAPFLGSSNSHQMNIQPTHKHKDSRPFISLGFSKPEDVLGGLPPQPDVQQENPLDNKAEGPFRVNNQIMMGKKQSLSSGTSSNTTTSYMSPLASHHLYQRVQDIYAKNIVHFDYPHSYHSLTYFLKQRFLGNDLSAEAKQKKRANLLVILKLIASYRPTFISAHKSLLKPYDLQFLEMSFQRSLLDCEKLAQLNLTPTIIWRRTGEIVSLSDDLLSLLGYKVREILSKRTFIMELMYDDESIVNYFKLFKSVAVGNLHLSIFTKCKLLKKNNLNNPESSESHDDYIEFCSVWTVKRDLFDLPMLIVGQFLPILPAGEGVRMY